MEKLHNEELNDLYSLSHIVRVINLRRMRWSGHVACIGERLRPIFNSYASFTVGVNSPQMSQNKCGELTHLRDMLFHTGFFLNSRYKYFISILVPTVGS